MSGKVNATQFEINAGRMPDGGSHCIACGGSFLAPFITTLAGSGAYFSGARVNTAIAISVFINAVAILFVGYTTLKLADQEKNFLLKP